MKIQRFPISYYQQKWGWDPRKKLLLEQHDELSYNSHVGQFVWAKDYELCNDPALCEFGIRIWAIMKVTRIYHNASFVRHGKWHRVTSNSKPYHSLQSHLRIGFGKYIEDAIMEDHVVSCLHTMVLNPTKISIEEHFVALCSYVDGIASLGISNMLHAQFDYSNTFAMSYGFNAEMQAQIIRSLFNISSFYCSRNLISDMLLDYLSGMIRNVDESWLCQHATSICGIYQISTLLSRSVLAKDTEEWILVHHFAQGEWEQLNMLLPGKAFKAMPSTHIGDDLW